jgi:hypothetical protein
MVKTQPAEQNGSDVKVNPPADITITICVLDRADIARAIAAVAEKREKAGMALRKGDVKRDNTMARAIRLKRLAEELERTNA